MLTDSEKKWLHRRKKVEGFAFCLHCPPGKKGFPCAEWFYDDCPVHQWNQDFRDAAEFEARVAAKLAEGPEDCAECFWGTSGWSADNAEGRLKHARLAVEKEMDAK